MRQRVAQRETVEDRGRRVSVSVDGMRLPEFVRWLSDTAGISVVSAAGLDDKTVTLDVTDQGVDDVLGMVARRLGVEITRTGRLYYIGELRKEDLGVLTRRVARLSAEELAGSVRVLLSDSGAVQSFEDGLIVVGDRVEVLRRVNELLDGIEAAESVTWAVQFYVVQLGESDLRDLGVDLEPAVELAYTFGATSAGMVPGAIAAADAVTRLDGGLSAVLRASGEAGSVRIVAEPLVLVGDGGKASVRRGQSVPIPQRTLTEQGAIQTTGYDRIETGLVLDVECRELSASLARLTLNLRLSEIDGFSGPDDVPITSQQTVETRCDVAHGGTYLVHSLQRAAKRDTWRKWLQFGQEKEHERTILQVWCRVYRIGTAVGGRTNEGLGVRGGGVVVSDVRPADRVDGAISPGVALGLPGPVSALPRVLGPVAPDGPGAAKRDDG